MENVSQEVKNIIADFKEKYDIEETKELNLNLSDFNSLELGCCLYLIHKMVKDLEYYLETGHEPEEVINEFYDAYKDIINDYIEVYCDNFTKDLYGKKFSAEQKKYVLDTIKNKYDINKCGIKSLTKMLDAGFSSLLKKDEKNKNEVKTVDFKKYKKTGKIVEKSDFDELQQRAIDAIKNIQSTAYNHPMYGDLSSDILKMIIRTTEDVDKLFDIYEKEPTNELRKKIIYSINSLDAAVNAMLDNANNLSVAKERFNVFIDRLVMREYLSKERALEFKERVDMCKTVSAVDKYNRILYTNYYYPKKAKSVKNRLEKKVGFWIKKDMYHEKLFNQLKEELFKKIDNGEVDKEELISIGEMGMDDAYEYISRGENSR